VAADPSSHINTPNKQEIGWIAYVCGGLSFIPCLGVPFGLAAIVLGVLKNSRRVIVLGACGIAFTVVLYGGLFYFGMYQRGGIYDKLRAQLAVTMLNSTVKEIEFYKVEHGSYPKSLKDLEPQEVNSFPSSEDPTATERGGAIDERFYYELDPSEKFYYLRSVGPDGVPFTADDILPSLPPSETQNTGLRLEKQSENQNSKTSPTGK
jgi:hypothetical protein